MYNPIRAIFDRLTGRSSSLTNPEQWLVDYFGGGGDTNAGREVSEDNALAMSTVYACVTLISETIASLPLRLYRKTDDGGREPVPGQVDDTVNTRPNQEMTSFDWRNAAVGHLLLWGNCYGLIERDRLGRLLAIWPIVPHRVAVKRKNGRIIYRITASDGRVRDYRADDIFHVKAFGYNGLVGQSVISFTREAIGLGLAAEEFGARFFGSGANPGLVLEHPARLSDEALKHLRESTERGYSGLGKSHKLMIVEDGMKATRVTIPPSDSQFIELRGFQREEICQIFKVPPHMVGLVTKSTSWGSGIEQQQIGFVVNTLRPWLVRWEQAMNKALLADSQRERGLFFEHRVEGLLRGDIKTRYDSYRIARQWGWLSVNDIRRLENMEPVEGGDQYLSPMNMVPLEDAGKVGLQKQGSPPGQPSTLDQGGADKEKKSSRERRGCGCGHVHAAPDDHSETRALEPDEIPAAGLLQAASGNRGALAEAFSALVAAETDSLRVLLAETGVDFTPAEIHRIIDDFYRKMPPVVKRKLQSALFRYQDDISAQAQKMIGKGGAGKALRRELEKWKREYLASLAQRYTADGLKQMNTIINGPSATDLLRAINARLDTWDLTRAGRYADEELVRAGNAMARETWARQGVAKLRWIARGTKTCPFCRQLSGKVVGIDKPFLENGETLYASDGKNWMAMNGKKMHPPIHRGCVCMIVPESSGYLATDPEAFIAARNALPGEWQPFLTPYSSDEYNRIGARVFVSPTGQSGFGITADGELISLFSLPGAKEGGQAIEDAIRHGANHLECFDTGLALMYAHHGFVETGRIAFDVKYAPSGWDQERFGSPDLVMMRLKNTGKDEKKSRRTMSGGNGHREGNIFIEPDGSAKTLGSKAFEDAEKNGTMLGKDDPKNTGTDEAKRITGEISGEFE